MGYKLALIVRSDINMSKGKIAAQVAHATVAATIKCYTSTTHFFRWQSDGETVIALKANKKTLNTIMTIATRKNVQCGTVCDAGRTEVAPDTITIGWVGPDTEEKIDKLTKQLKLL